MKIKTQTKYLISIKRTHDYHGMLLEKDKQYWEFVTANNSTGRPCYNSDERRMMIFDSIKQAKEWWNFNKQYLSSQYINTDHYDMSTLGIMERIIDYKSIETLSD